MFDRQSCGITAISPASECVSSELDLDRDGTGGALGSVDVLARVGSPRDLRGLSGEELVELAAAMKAFLVDKVSVTGGGVGSAVAARMREARVDTPVRSIGVPQRFLDHASRNEIHTDLGLTADDLVTTINSWIQRPAEAVANESGWQEG